MANISGSVIFDVNRSATIDPGDTPLSGVSVVLQDRNTLRRITVKTDNAGNYLFINVPNGNYRIVEAYGEPTIYTGIADFNMALVGTVPIEKNPPIGIAANPPNGANTIDSITPDTIIVQVNVLDLQDQNFLDGPVKYTPISVILDPCTTLSANNLITVADNGTFGSYAAGTLGNTGNAVNPYPGLAPDYTYVQPNPNVFTPDGGQYTIQNLVTNALSNGIGNWWRIADHTTGNETGRLMLVNGYSPGSIFFTTKVNVAKNTNYLFSAWIMNIIKLNGLELPAFGVEILDQNNNVIYNANLGLDIPISTQVPEWKEIGTVLNSGNNTSLTINFISQGPEAGGNDYAMDDVELRQISIPIMTPVKSIDKTQAYVGDTVTYTVTLANTCKSPLKNGQLDDVLPQELKFVDNSVYINGVNTTLANPNDGFSLPDVPGDGIVTITFQATATTLPTSNPVHNTATTSYQYTPVEGGVLGDYTAKTNVVDLIILPKADVKITKTTNTTIVAGQIITYNLKAENLGPSPAENVIVQDTIPTIILNPQYSIDGGLTYNPWLGTLNLNTLVSGQIQNIIIQGTLSAAAQGNIVNTANIGTTTTDPDLSNNTSSVTNQINTSADLSIVKTMTQGATAGEDIEYSLIINNAGPSDSQNVIIADTLDSNISNGEFSLDNGITWNQWSGSTSKSTVVNGESITVLIRGKLNSTVTGTIVNTATVSAATPDTNLNNNVSQVQTNINTSADVGVIKTSTLNSVVAGETLVYSIKTFNLGPSKANNVVLMDTVPLNNPQLSIDGGQTYIPWTSSYTIGDLVSGASKTILIRGQVSSSTTGTIPNTAKVSSDTPDPNSSNNTSTVITTVAEVADISVVKTQDPNPLVPGLTGTYKIVVNNLGPSDSKNVKVIDQVPVVFSNLEYSTDGVNYYPLTNPISIGTIESGGTREIYIRGLVAASATGIITNKVTITSSTYDPNLGNNTYILNSPQNTEADISVVKTGAPNPVVAGTTITYTLNMHNAGPSDSENVILTDTIVSTILNPEISTDGGSSWATWGGTYGVGTFLINSSKSVLIRGIIDSTVTLPISNSASINATTTDPNTSNNNSSIITNVNAEADISVIKTVDNIPLVAGYTVSYTIKVDNHGPSLSQNVTLTDTIPDYISNVEFSIDGGATYNQWVTPYSIGDLPKGDSKTIKIRGILASSVTGTVVNTAIVSATTPDPNLNNNTATVSAGVNTLTDLKIEKIQIIDPLIAGEEIYYIMDVSNKGPSDAKNVKLIDNIPNEILSPVYSIDGGVSFNAWSGSYDIGTLPVGSTETVIIKGTIDSATTSSITNIASVTTTTSVINPEDDSSTVVNPINTLADIYVDKTIETKPIYSGDTVVYKINVGNNGPSDSLNVVLTDIISQKILNPQFSIDGGVTYNNWTGSYYIGTLSVGQLKTIYIKGTVSDDTGNIISNTATVSSITEDPNQTNNTSTAEFNISIVKLTMTKVADKECLEICSEFNYTIEVKNIGNTIVEDIVLTDTLPNGLKVNEIIVDGTIVSGNLSQGINIGTLKVGETKKITVNIKAIGNVQTTFFNIAYATGIGIPSPSAPTKEVTVSAVDDVGVFIINPEIDVLKLADKECVKFGDTIAFSIIIKNSGNITIGDLKSSPLVLYDCLDPNLEYIPCSLSMNGKPIPNQNINNGIIIDSISPGQEITVSFMARVIYCKEIIIKNMAKVCYGYKVLDECTNTLCSFSNYVCIKVYLIDSCCNTDDSFYKLGDNKGHDNR